MKRLSNRLIAQVEETARRRQQEWDDHCKAIEARFPFVVELNPWTHLGQGESVMTVTVPISEWLHETIGEYDVDHSGYLRGGGAGWVYCFLNACDALSFEIKFGDLR